MLKLVKVGIPGKSGYYPLLGSKPLAVIDKKKVGMTFPGDTHPKKVIEKKRSKKENKQDLKTKK